MYLLLPQYTINHSKAILIDRLLNLNMSDASDNEKILIEKLQDLNLLKIINKCSKCNNTDLKLVKLKRNKDGNKIYSWRCKIKKCLSYSSIKKDS
jgi:hypothetical protein